MSEQSDEKPISEEDIPPPYHYFDTPEGSDIFKKLVVSLKPPIIAGLIVSAVDVFTSRKKRTHSQIVHRILHICQPMVGGTVAFVLVSNIVAKFRGKGDKLSWFLGGASAGIVFGSWWGSGVAIVGAAIFFGGLCAIRKDFYDKGFIIIPEKKTTLGGCTSWQHDWTLTKHIPGNYKTSEK